MANAIVGDFEGPTSARAAVQRLRTLGVPPTDISVIVEEPYVDTYVRRDADGVVAGALTGGASGAILGGLAGWVLSLGGFDLWGLGRFAAENAPGAALAGGGAGAALLGLLGGIAGLTFNDHPAPPPDEGDVLVTVRAGVTPLDVIERVMREHGALNVQPTGELPGDPVPAPAAVPEGHTTRPEGR